MWQVYSTNQAEYQRVEPDDDESDDAAEAEEKTEAEGAAHATMKTSKAKTSIMLGEIASQVPAQGGPGKPTMIAKDFVRVPAMNNAKIRRLQKTFPLVKNIGLPPHLKRNQKLLKILAKSTR